MAAVEVVKSATDDREYRLITLKNGLEALLVHDHTAEKAAAALDVNIGSLADPDEIPGLAHFLEHLLFMGTEKYPDENEYSRYLADHAGMGNAFTSAEDTNFHFEVAADALEGALDRFSRFFIDPLFSESCQDREIMAVDSENKKNLQLDTWRFNQLEKSLSNPDHPHHKFSTGNFETLSTIPKKDGINVRERLIEFYRQHYAAHLMKLVVLGVDSLDTLESQVRRMFSEVPDDPAKHPKTYSTHPLTQNELGTLIKAQPVMDIKHLELSFPVPDQQELVDTQPQLYYAHLLGHESAGSLLHYLKEQKWASELTAGLTHVSKGSDMFLLGIELTNEGYEHWRDVLAATFAYIDMVRSLTPQQWVFEEVATMSRASFEFRQKTNALRFVRVMASTMQRPIPRERLLDLSVVKQFDASMIANFGEYLNERNVRALLTVSPNDSSELVHREKWYGTPYKVENLEWKDSQLPPTGALHMPRRNEFLPQSFVVEAEQAPNRAEKPRLVLRDDARQLRVWHKRDDTFILPKVTAFVKLRSPYICGDAMLDMLTEVYVALVVDALSDYAYYAQSAGLHYGLGPIQDGLELEVAGFDEKMPRLVQVVVENVLCLPDDRVRRRFTVIKEKMHRMLSNVRMVTPYAQLTSSSHWLLAERVYNLEEKVDALAKIQEDDVLEWVSKFRSGLGVELLAVGNVSAATVADLGVAIRAKAPILDQPIERAQSYWLPTGSHSYYRRTLADPQNVNSAIDYFVQIGETRDTRRHALLLLLVQLLGEPTFQQLRTTEMLGYVVGCTKRVLRGTLYLRFFIQSEEATTYLEDRIEHFLGTVAKTRFLNMSDDDYTYAVRSVVHQCLEKPKNISEEATRFWSAINQETYDFGRRRELANIVEKVSKQEFVDLFLDLVDPISPRHTVFVTHLESSVRKPVAPEVALARAVGKLVGERHVKVTPQEITAFSQQCRQLSPQQAMGVLREKLVESGQSPEEADKFVEDAMSISATAAVKPPFKGTEVTDGDAFRSSLTLAPAPPAVNVAVYEDAKL